MKELYRGHKIEKVDDSFVYTDTGCPVSENIDRECGYCGKNNTKEGHDGCLGILENVMNACCGHGDEKQAYAQFSDGNIIDGVTATNYFHETRWKEHGGEN